MIYFAYDGSLNGDWVSRYAIRIASQQPEKTLRLIYVRDAQEERTREKIERIARECEAPGVSLETDIHPPSSHVLNILKEIVPAGSDNCLICGTRVRRKKKGYFFGTISHKLILHNGFPVLAIRVVQPGLLGNPADILLTAAGSSGSEDAGLHFLRLFSMDARRIHLAEVLPDAMTRRPVREKILSEKKYLHELARSLELETELKDAHIDYFVSVSGNWPREMAMQAGRLKSRMILTPVIRQGLIGGIFKSNPLEQLLGLSHCDVAVFGGPV